MPLTQARNVLMLVNRAIDASNVTINASRKYVNVYVIYKLLCRSNMYVNVEIVCINSDYYKRGAFRALCVDDLLERESI